jgi:hypothetical protein
MLFEIGVNTYLTGAAILLVGCLTVNAVGGFADGLPQKGKGGMRRIGKVFEGE